MNRHMEQFEARRMMSVAASAAAGTLYVYGDDQGNGLSVEKSGSDLVVKKHTGGTNYSEFYRTKASGITKIRMYGRGGPDTLTVNKNVTARAYINGGAGADYLQGGGGVNALYGHDQNNPADDDAAADTLVSGWGTTSSFGQKGNDTFFTTFLNSFPSQGEDILMGGDGNDRFVVGGMRKVFSMGEWGDDTFESRQTGKPSMQRTDFLGGFGKDTIDISHFSAGLDIYLGYKGKPTGMHGGRHWINLQVDTEVAIGGSGDDNLIGNDYANTLRGGDGNDDLYGLDGNDSLYGENGWDTITGDWGNDRIYGGPNSDVLRGHDGHDTIFGNGGNDRIYGAAGNDKCYGGDGNDVIFGEKGNDYLVGGTGDDTFHAADGVFFNDIVFGGNEDRTGEQLFHDKASMDFKNNVLVDTAFGIDEFE